MGKLNRLHNIIGWAVFGIAMIVYILSAERTGSLWDCGEFILGAYKLQVVHPPGAPLFLLIGRIFTFIAEIFSSNPEDIAFAVNLMSGVCTAFSAGFVAWVTIRLSKLAYYGRNEEVEVPQGENIALAGAGLVAGLATAFCTSIWFSAVEGEVYAMSLFFTCLTLWSMIKWYTLPDVPSADRWLMLTIFSAGLAIGVHLLSILTLPAMAIFYYFKKWEGRTTWLGIVASVLAGVAVIVFIQSVIIVGIPNIWHGLEIFMVNSLGMPVHSGIVPTLALVVAGIYFGLRYAHRKNSSSWQQFFVASALLVIAYSTVGVVLIRAEAKPPVNMNNPDNVTSLLPYLNREQYGERSLLYGPSFDAQVIATDVEERYGLVNGKYEEAVTYKISPEYPKKDMMFFPRMSDGSQSRPRLYKQWMGLDPQQPLPGNRPNFVDNIKFLWNYQLGQMYWRYFMWNFAGRQNGQQGFYSWDKSAGNWISGIGFIDEMRLGEQSELTDKMIEDPARNTYYLIPFLFGLLGLIWHAGRRGNDFTGLLGLFVITGIGIIIYTNQPPNEPRERDYVLVGSFFTFCIWMGMAVPALYAMAKDKLGQSGLPVAAGITVLVLVAPVLMASQNFDDHSRRYHKASRDYAANFLNSVEENAIIFTYGDNDTYPLWYAQEVENIRRDVRVVNLSLIAVDWYIDLLRRKVNDSPAINLTIPKDALRGRKRNQVYRVNAANQEGPCSQDRPRALSDLINELGSDQPFRNGGRTLETFYSSCNVAINVNVPKARAAGLIPSGDQPVSRIPVRVNKTRLLKDEIAILDIINSNMYDRPIYWAVTCQPSKMMGLQPYLQLQGLGLKLTVTKHENDSAYGVIGSGQVDTEKNYDIILNKWKWGNFDKVDTHVNSSYAPALQAMQLTMRRTAMEFLASGEDEKALEIADQYFEAFPDFNFRYKYNTVFMLDVYFRAKAWDRALPHVEILAKNTADELDFYESLSDADLTSSYQTEYSQALSVMQRLVQAGQQSGNEEFKSRVEAILANHLYMLQQGGQTPG
ncbi:membrane protein [Lewinellaceae bacterium SD302]|nr:membrane protein [Lewinellaceae bacterium SD302]